jgi:hypothetical protein
VAATVTFQETAGVGGRITRVVANVVRLPSGQSSGGGLDVTLAIGPSGTVTDRYTQEFDVTADVDSVVCRFSATGVDTQGRTFTATTSDVPVNPPTAAAPPPLPPNTARLELWGGPSSATFLGCWSCSQFAGDSVFNQFGRFASRSSPTSIWNHFSDYGSPFSQHSACNDFATNPPQLVNTATVTYQELTLNQFRPFAIRDSSVLGYLRNVICER